MQISPKGIALIKEFEGCILTAYKDPGAENGLPITIGIGSTMYTDGSKIKLGDVITQEKAEQLLAWEVGNKASVLNGNGIKVNQNQFDSLCSFIFNIGVGAFNKSTLLKKVKANPNDPTIANEFLKWNKNNGKVMKGLTRRRQAESDLYFAK